MKSSPPAKSQQGLQRAMSVLRVIATQGRRGMTFTAIAAASRLPQATLHRLLAALVCEGLAHLDTANRRYYLGHSLHELGLAALPVVRFAEPARAALEHLAAVTGDTVYLSERVGNEAVTTARVEGAFPFKTLVLHVGMRRPLGVGAGGLAILAALEPQEAERIVQSNMLQLPALAGFDSDFLLEAVAQTRTRGFAYLDDRATRGMAAVGVALYDAATDSRAAISIAAVTARMTFSKAEHLAQSMVIQAREVEAAMRNLPKAGRGFQDAV